MRPAVFRGRRRLPSWSGGRFCGADPLELRADLEGAAMCRIIGPKLQLIHLTRETNAPAPPRGARGSTGLRRRRRADLVGTRHVGGRAMTLDELL